MQAANRDPPEGFEFNRKAVQDHLFDLPVVEHILARPDVTLHNRQALLCLQARALNGSTDLPRYLPCCGLHPHTTSCWTAAVIKFARVWRWILPTYAVLNFVPSVLFRFPAFRADPARILARASVGSARSSAFLGMFVTLVYGRLLF
jgi:hypothetical protein